MELDKQLLGLFFGAIVVIFLWVNLRNPYSGKNDRRKKEQRSGLRDRRVSKRGRRKANQLKHESQLTDRRQERSERRVDERNRRHRKRRKSDRVH